MKYRALFVGVDGYTGGISTLNCARKDATALHERFSSMGYDAHVLRDVGAHVILDKVRTLMSDLTKDDLFLFFFAGHGYTDRHAERRLACAGDTLDRVKRGYDGISLSELKDGTSQYGCRRVFILDACQTVVDAARACADLIDNVPFSKRDLEAVADIGGPPENTETTPIIVINSCQVGELAYELDGHGLFTDALIRILPASQEEASDLLFDEAFTSRIAKQMSLISAGRYAQRPQCFFANGFPSVPVFFRDPDTTYEECPICHRNRHIRDTYNCPVCKRHFICSDDYLIQEGCCKACRAQMGNVPGEERVIRLPDGHEMTFCWCPSTRSTDWKKLSGGNDYFEMGSPAEEAGRSEDEVLHRVSLSRGFWIAQTPVTQRQFCVVTGRNPSKHNLGDDMPVTNVSWRDSLDFCSLLAKLISGARFVLPTEAQWEYACRAGTKTALNTGLNLTSEFAVCSNLDEVAWYCENCGGEMHLPGKKRANAWNLFDMHGNVREWCAERYSAYHLQAQIDPMGMAGGRDRVIRGGGYNCSAHFCRSASRNRLPGGNAFSDVGFRPIMVPFGT